MKIAVVGAGVSGLVAAYLLSRRHEVLLFERNAYFGGHSNTVSISSETGPLCLDTGFIVYNEAAYPRFVRLLTELAVGTQPSDMSFSVTCRACDVAFSSRGLSGALASPRTFLSPEGLRFARDLWRFFRRSRRDLASPGIEHLTVAQYLSQGGFGGALWRHFLAPLTAAVWSMPPGRVGDFPAAYLLRFLTNHGLIGSGGDGWRWRTVTGGSQSYVQALLRCLGDTSRCATPVETVCRNADGVTIHTAAGESIACDAAVLACHADEAHRLLVERSRTEDDALSSFEYTRNRVVLHTDTSFLPVRPAHRGSWNYVTSDCRDNAPVLTSTYYLNRLQSLSSPRDYCLSLNAATPPPAEHVLREFEYDHPAYTFNTLAGQRKLRALNGKDRIFYAGAHLGYGFHEDGVESAYRVAALLGVEDA